MTAVTERALHQLIAANGFRVEELRRNKHYWVRVQRETGGPTFGIGVATSPKVDFRFERDLRTILRRGERAAHERTREPTVL